MAKKYDLTKILIIFVILSTDLTTSTPTTSFSMQVVSKEEWGGKDAKSSVKMSTPVKNVVIHHSYIPGACESEVACANSVKGMQRFHMVDRGWADIGYSFLVGGDNRAYLGRGWDNVGAHSPKFNRNSIGICIIGNWTDTLPPEAQLQSVKDLIKYGVQLGKIEENYKLFGHRQGSNTECPGEAFYQEIQTWPHYSPQ